VEVKVYANLRPIIGGKSLKLEASEMTVEQMLETLFTRYPALADKLLSRDGQLHSAFHILINGRDFRYLNGLETLITAEDEVRIFPPVGGGSQ
jgi:MoaD family protein